MSASCEISRSGFNQDFLVTYTEYTAFTVVQWFCLIVIAVFIPLYSFAIFSLYRTGRGFTFDTCISIFGLVLNILVAWNTYVYCIDTLIVIYKEMIVVILMVFCLLLVLQVQQLDQKAQRDQQALSSSNSYLPPINSEIVRTQSSWVKHLAVPTVSFVSVGLLAILINSVVHEIINKGNNGETYNWIIFLVIDTLLSTTIMVWYCHAESQLSEFSSRISGMDGDSEFNRDSDVLQIRRRQLKIFAYFFLILDLLYIVFIVLVDIFDSNSLKLCLEECAVPTTSTGAALLSIKELLTLAQIEFYFFVFYFLQRRAIVSASDDVNIVMQRANTLQLRADSLIMTYDEDQLQPQASPRMILSRPMSVRGNIGQRSRFSKRVDSLAGIQDYSVQNGVVMDQESQDLLLD